VTETSTGAPGPAGPGRTDAGPAGTGEEAAAARRRAETVAQLQELLPRRQPGERVSVLGAGSDDLERGRQYLQKLAPGGWMVPTWPLEHGGLGLAGAEAQAVRAALAEFEAPDLYPWMVGLDLIGPTLLAHASEEQKARWLPGIRDGSEIWCQMFSEPDAGSDLAGLKARATPDGDGWRISGSKVWTSRAHYARWGLLLARTDPAQPKHRGITAFGLDMTSPGVTVKPLVQMNRDAHFNEVFLDDVWVPDHDRIGAPGEGWRVALTCLTFERGALGGGLGVRADQLRRLGSHIAPADRVGRDEWAARQADFEVARWTAMRAAQARRAGRPPGPEDSGSKLRGTAMIKQVAALAMRVEGPAALVGTDHPDEWQSLFLVSPSLSIRGGTDEIQRNILGERVLGLPPEPRLDKDQPFNQT
jgi:alkylation response protein AidB-like acyl-CoA dehydrogenase